jgi:hypothetical protein
MRKKKKPSSPLFDPEGEPWTEEDFEKLGSLLASCGDPDHAVREFMSLSPEEQNAIWALMSPKGAKELRQRIQELSKP